MVFSTLLSFTGSFASWTLPVDEGSGSLGGDLSTC